MVARSRVKIGALSRECCQILEQLLMTDSVINPRVSRSFTDPAPGKKEEEEPRVHALGSWNRRKLY